MKIKLDITPSTEMVRSWKQDSRINLVAVIKELVDNSLDWGATKIEITKSELGIFVRDNGTGIRDIRSALRFGDSADVSNTRRLGRFGIALKKGPARLARTLNIDTQNATQKIVLQVDWSHLEKSGEWSIEPDITRNTNGRTYTCVTLLNFYKHRLAGWETLPQVLATTFAPALKDGKIISFEGTPIALIAPLNLENLIEADGTCGPNGGFQRFFHVRAGLIADGDTRPRPTRGIALTYLHRVVVDEWLPKFLSNCSLRRFFAEVTLIDGDGVGSEDFDFFSKWQLNNFKDDIESWQKDELEPILKTILQPLLDMLKEERASFRIKTIEQTLQRMLKASKGSTMREDGKDPLREIGERQGVRGPRRQRRKKQHDIDAEATNNGEMIRTNAERSIKLAFEHVENSNNIILVESFGDDELLITVNIATDYGNQLKEQMDRDETALLIQMLTWSLGCYMTSRDNYAKKFPYILNGTDDIFEASIQNVSRWLELGATV
jgi:hypothetical protein